MAYKAQFITALGQHEIVFDAKVNNDMVVGQVCKYDSTNNIFTPTSVKPAVGDYIVAQSDVTMQSYVPVENRDYRYDPKVAASTSATKKVAMFKITDINDVYSITI